MINSNINIRPPLLKPAKSICCPGLAQKIAAEQSIPLKFCESSRVAQPGGDQTGASMWAQGRPGEDKALSIVLRFPSTLFLNHPGLKAPFSPTDPLPFQYIHHEAAQNKHIPALITRSHRAALIHLRQQQRSSLQSVARGGGKFVLIDGVSIVFSLLKKALLSVITFSAPLFHGQVTATLSPYNGNQFNRKKNLTTSYPRVNNKQQ